MNFYEVITNVFITKFCHLYLAFLSPFCEPSCPFLSLHVQRDSLSSALSDFLFSQPTTLEALQMKAYHSPLHPFLARL